MNKHASIGSFDGEERQDCSTRTGLQAMPHDIQGTEGNKEAAHIPVFAKET
jgi:hypothetical protein